MVFPTQDPSVNEISDGVITAVSSSSSAVTAAEQIDAIDVSADVAADSSTESTNPKSNVVVVGSFVGNNRKRGHTLDQSQKKLENVAKKVREKAFAEEVNLQFWERFVTTRTGKQLCKLCKCNRKYS